MLNHDVSLTFRTNISHAGKCIKEMLLLENGEKASQQCKKRVKKILRKLPNSRNLL